MEPGMKYTVRVTDGHCFRDIDIETDNGVQEACSLAMGRATEIERAGNVCCWEHLHCDCGHNADTAGYLG
jgi:hypothetical protein